MKMERVIIIAGLCLITTCVISQATPVQGLPTHFFPVDADMVTNLKYGQETSGPIPLTSNFTLFQQTTDVINVNKNGVLSFPNPMLDSILMRNERLLWRNTVALYFTDNMPNYGNGTINYIEYVPGNITNERIQKAKELVTDQFSCYSTFEPESVFVATYINMKTRYECVQDNSKKYCSCLGSKQHYGDTDFCECGEKHSESYCRECEFGNSGHLRQFCKCLDSKDDMDYCTCKENKRNGADVRCKCLRDHDVHYCDCLDQSNSPEHAWNCSCMEKYDDESMCDCLRDNDDNVEYCRCQFWNYPLKTCSCYLTHSKEFCDCMEANDEMEGYCDCLEQGKHYKFCRCVHFEYISFLYDVYMVETFCQCLMTKNNNTVTYMGDGSGSSQYWRYCTCVVEKGAAANCVDNTKRDATETCYDRAVANNLAREEGSTYQLVLISGGGMSFVVFNYGYWSTKINVVEAPAGWGFWGVQRGMIARGRNPSFYSRYYDLSSHSANTQYWCQLEISTHNVPGQLIFRTDRLDVVVKPGCVTAPIGARPALTWRVEK